VRLRTRAVNSVRGLAKPCGYLAGEVSENPGGLNRSMQHRLGVYSQEFQSPRFFRGR
jgi:hypothetical protein